MKGLRALISILLIYRVRSWIFSPVAAPEVLSNAPELYDVHITRSLQQSTPQANVCPETEYYCGPGDAFEKEAHDALNQPKGCNYDNGKGQQAHPGSVIIGSVYIRLTGLQRYVHVQTLSCGSAAHTL